jgi:hypothetical protein
MSLQPPAAFRWGPLVLGLPAGVVVGLLVAWLAVPLQRHFAPWLFFPVLIGLLVGATLVALVRLSQVGHRRTILLLAFLAALTTVIGQHYLSYHYVRALAREEAQRHPEASQLAPMFLGRPSAPNSFAEFLASEASRGRRIGPYTAHNSLAWLSWGLDGLLVLCAALSLVMPALKRPYCNRCRSWFRTTRTGQMDIPTAQCLAKLLEMPPPEGLRSARYRLVACNGGCGPTGFELCWDTPVTRVSPIWVWLDLERRNQIVAILDDAAQETREPFQIQPDGEAGEGTMQQAPRP